MIPLCTHVCIGELNKLYCIVCIVLYCICDICRVVYMSLWSSGQRELEGREVLVLPPHDRVG